MITSQNLFELMKEIFHLCGNSPVDQKALSNKIKEFDSKYKKSNNDIQSDYHSIWVEYVANLE